MFISCTTRACFHSFSSIYPLCHCPIIEHLTWPQKLLTVWLFPSFPALSSVLEGIYTQGSPCTATGERVKGRPVNLCGVIHHNYGWLGPQKKKKIHICHPHTCQLALMFLDVSLRAGWEFFSFFFLDVNEDKSRGKGPACKIRKFSSYP